MWDQKSGQNISVLDGTKHISGSGIKSGTTNLTVDDKLLESHGEDSGFISGPLNSSDHIEKQQSIIDDDIIPDNFQHFGAIDGNFDQNNAIENYTKDIKKTEESMILDSGIEFGLSERFCSFSLTNSTGPLNNLDGCRKTNIQDDTKKQFNRPLYELIYCQDDDGDTKLHLAILGNYEIAETMIHIAPVPAFLDIRNDDGHTPLHYAVLTRQPKIVRSLLIAGAKATIGDCDGNTPLHLACKNNDIHSVLALTSPLMDFEMDYFYQYANRNLQVFPPVLEQRNYEGRLCVHIAAERNNIDILRHLVWLGSDINVRTGRSGYTALHMACESRNEKLVKFLLEECKLLDIEAVTYSRWTAYQIAANQNDHNIMKLLAKCGAEVMSPPQSDDEDDDSCFSDSE